MFYLRRIPGFSVAAGVLLLGTAAARAELVSTSPFLPPQTQVAVVAPVVPPNLEFRGITTMQNATAFLVYDGAAMPPRKKEIWLKLNEPGQGLSVKKYDAVNDTITVDYQGRSHPLQMKTPKIASSGALPPPSVAVPLVMQTPIANPPIAKLSTAPTTLTPAAAPPPAVAPPTTAAEAERLAEWTSEIERRRNARNTPAGATPATPPPQSTPTVPAVGRSGQAAPARR
jgi:hypothetical protein